MVRPIRAFIDGKETPRKPSKYHNKRTEAASGGTFASMREAAKADQLRMWEKIGAISDLEFQVKYELIPKQKGESALSYVCDFKYRDTKDGRIHVLDSKGMRTDVYKIKKKLMQFIHHIVIEEV
jgi:hypothetical protein